ncbi:Non-specific serine/threonine protein kinase [Altererythrobacter insulae]|nr:Non-specific serine/threonine protein kinase [Altererythrobacter insulae]
MADTSVPDERTGKMQPARIAPGIAALALALAASSSVGQAPERAAAPRAVFMLEQGRMALAQNDIDAAIDAYESALALDPGLSDALIALAQANRANGLPGKAIGYYRSVLAREPRNIAALAGEGEALAESGALEKARRNLAQLESLCGRNCAKTNSLRAKVETGRAASLAAESAEDGPSSNQ